MVIREVPISDIKPAAYNPRADLQPDDPEYKRIEKSLDEFDLVEPLVWNEATGNLVSGHQRLKICIARGIDVVTCSVVHIEDQKKEAALNIALNNAFGKWDYPKLKDIISEIDDGNFDIEVTGFDSSELNKMFGIYTDNENPDNTQIGSGKFGILIECESEFHQSELLSEFISKGIECKSLML